MGWIIASFHTLNNLAYLQNESYVKAFVDFRLCGMVIYINNFKHDKGTYEFVQQASPCKWKVVCCTLLDAINKINDIWVQPLHLRSFFTSWDLMNSSIFSLSSTSGINMSWVRCDRLNGSVCNKKYTLFSIMFSNKRNELF